MLDSLVLDIKYAQCGNPGIGRLCVSDTSSREMYQLRRGSACVGWELMTAIKDKLRVF